MGFKRNRQAERLRCSVQGCWEELLRDKKTRSTKMMTETPSWINSILAMDYFMVAV